jgi:hypothetical protein
MIDPHRPRLSIRPAMHIAEVQLNCPGFCGDSKTCEVRRIHEQQIEAFSA